MALQRETDTRPLSDLTPEERAQRITANACVPTWKLEALVALLIAKGLITEADLTGGKR